VLANRTPLDHPASWAIRHGDSAEATADAMELLRAHVTEWPHPVHQVLGHPGVPLVLSNFVGERLGVLDGVRSHRSVNTPCHLGHECELRLSPVDLRATVQAAPVDQRPLPVGQPVRPAELVTPYITGLIPRARGVTDQLTEPQHRRLTGSFIAPTTVKGRVDDIPHPETANAREMRAQRAIDDDQSRRRLRRA
jgi:hypothetical protein